MILFKKQFYLFLKGEKLLNMIKRKDDLEIFLELLLVEELVIL